MSRKSESQPRVSETGEYSGSEGGPERDTEAFSTETPVTAMRDPEWRPAVRTDEGKEPEWMKRPEGRGEWTQDDGDEGPATRLPDVPSLGSLDTPALIAICIGVFVGVFLVGTFTLMWWMKTTPDAAPIQAAPVEKTHEGLPVRKGIQ